MHRENGARTGGADNGALFRHPGAKLASAPSAPAPPSDLSPFIGAPAGASGAAPSPGDRASSFAAHISTSALPGSKRNGAPLWGSGLSSKSRAADVAGKPAPLRSAPLQDGDTGQENLVTRITQLQASEAEAERRLHEQRARLREKQHALEQLQQRLASLQQPVAAADVSSASDSDEPTHSPSPVKSAPAPSSPPHAATDAVDMSRALPPPDAAQRDPFSGRNAAANASRHHPGAPACVRPEDASVAAVLEASRFIAARTAHEALTHAPPHLAALSRATRVYTHHGHAVAVQPPLHTCPQNMAAYHAAVDAHDAHKHRLVALTRARAAAAAARDGALAQEYARRAAAHAQHASFEPEPPPMPRFGLSFLPQRPADDPALVDAHRGNFECAMPAQMAAEDAESALYQDRSRLVPDPVAALQEAKITRPWTPAEKETFKTKFLEHFKDFQALSDAMGTRGVLEVTQHFYEVRKKDEFKNHDRKLTFKKRRDGIKERNEKNAMFGPLSGVAPRASGGGGAPPASALPAPAPARKASSTALERLGSVPRRGGAAGGGRGGDVGRGFSDPSLDLAAAAPVAAAAAAQPRARTPQLAAHEYCAAVRAVGKSFGKLAAALGCTAPQARDFWARNKERLHLESHALEHSSAQALGSFTSWTQPSDGVPDMATVMGVPKAPHSVSPPRFAKLDTSGHLPAPLEHVTSAPPLDIAALRTGLAERSAGGAADAPGLLRSAVSDGGGLAALLPLASPRFSDSGATQPRAPFADLLAPPPLPTPARSAAATTSDTTHPSVSNFASILRPLGVPGGADVATGGPDPMPPGCSPRAQGFLPATAPAAPVRGVANSLLQRQSGRAPPPLPAPLVSSGFSSGSADRISAHTTNTGAVAKDLSAPPVASCPLSVATLAANRRGGASGGSPKGASPQHSGRGSLGSTQVDPDHAAPLMPLAPPVATTSAPGSADQLLGGLPAPTGATRAGSGVSGTRVSATTKRAQAPAVHEAAAQAAAPLTAGDAEPPSAGAQGACTTDTSVTASGAAALEDGAARASTDAVPRGGLTELAQTNAEAAEAPQAAGAAPASASAANGAAGGHKPHDNT